MALHPFSSPDWQMGGAEPPEPRSWSSCIAIVVVMVVVLLVVLVVALLKLQKKNIGFPASATLSQQASDAGLMEEIQELAELTQPEDTSGGDRSAVLNGKLLSSAEMLNVAGLESDEPRLSQCQQEISMSVPESGEAQQPLNLSEHFAQLSWYDALAGTWAPIAVIRPGKSNPLHSSFAGHISVSNRWFTVVNAGKAIAGVYKIESEMKKSKCLVFIRLIVTEPAPTSVPTSVPASQVALVSVGTAAAEPGSWSNRIAEVVVPVVGAMMVVALLIWQIKNIARYMHLFCSRRDFPARAAPFQQASDSGPMQEMQELAELTQPEDASGGDRSAMMNGKLLGSAETLNAGGLESGEG
ncbi:hypothetical protein KIL84_001554 [Mauremys mutica]|uniref:Uncharacterized protein n=2 Tax=Mauremys mutica TaxID=74926 RepID=A0A9D3XKB7_9SAUR|nr:hypothetical protein KIL84_001554 [Mauremys mutica]